VTLSPISLRTFSAAANPAGFTKKLVYEKQIALGRQRIARIL